MRTINNRPVGIKHIATVVSSPGRPDCYLSIAKDGELIHIECAVVSECDTPCKALENALEVIKLKGSPQKFSLDVRDNTTICQCAFDTIDKEKTNNSIENLANYTSDCVALVVEMGTSSDAKEVTSES